MTKKVTFIIILIAILALGFYAWRYSTQKQDNISPPKGELASRMVLGTTLDFAKAVQARDLSLFRATTSEIFKKQFSHQQFRQAFGGYIQQNINLFPVAKTSPIFTEKPNMDQNGTLRLKGYFPTRPSRVYFDYSYNKENGQWKLTGITLNVRPLQEKD